MWEQSESPLKRERTEEALAVARGIREPGAGQPQTLGASKGQI